MKNDYDRQILALTDSELERFINDWLDYKAKDYVEITRFSGAGDLGRDVVGFLSKNLHEGVWHNYQCKQYKKNLPTATALLEVGKILYYAYKGEFTVPEKYFFVAPRGVNRNLEKLLYNPGQFKEELVNNWDKYCSEKLKENTVIPLDISLKSFIETIDFSVFKRLTLDNILTDTHIKPVLHSWFGENLGQAPVGITPKEILGSELPYIQQLLEAYSQRSGQTFKTHKELAPQPIFSQHLSIQRERFFDADAFKRFYRDNTSPDILKSFEHDIYHGVVDRCNGSHRDAFECVEAVMVQAANIQAAGPLAQYARVPVKQGVCHHFANEGVLKWKQPKI
jgi:hypothetical protein